VKSGCPTGCRSLPAHLEPNNPAAPPAVKSPTVGDRLDNSQACTGLPWRARSTDGRSRIRSQVVNFRPAPSVLHMDAHGELAAQARRGMPNGIRGQFPGEQNHVISNRVAGGAIAADRTTSRYSHPLALSLLDSITSPFGGRSPVDTCSPYIILISSKKRTVMNLRGRGRSQPDCLSLRQRAPGESASSC
jgi:hypothetical protein